MPAGTAITPQVLEKEYYDYGIALSSTLSQTALIVGTAAAAAIIALIGSAGAIYIDMATFILSAILIACMKVKESKAEKPQQMEEKEENYWSVFSSGVKYLVKSKVVMLLTGLVIILNALTVPVNSLQAPMASELFGGGAEILSILSIAIMAGSIVGAMIYPKVKELLSGRILSFLTGIGMAFFYLGIVMAQPLYGSKVFMYIYVFLLSEILGMIVALMSSYCSAQVLSRTDEAYLARVSAVLQSLSIAVSPVIALIISMVVKVTNTTIIFIIVGVISIMISIPMLFVKILDTPTPKEDNITTA